jgi:hypothetical protein
VFRYIPYVKGQVSVANAKEKLTQKKHRYEKEQEEFEQKFAKLKADRMTLRKKKKIRV